MGAEISITDQALHRNSTFSSFQTATGSSSSSPDEFAHTRFPDGCWVELIEG